METTATSVQSVLPTSSGDTKVNATDASALSSDFETFLRMLTVQMENQDPLNPIESSDFAVQLATFSGVEQQVQTNDLLANLAAEMSLMGMSQLAGWVGMEGRAAAPVYFGGAPVSLAPKMPTGIDQATIVVRNEQGVEVSRSAIPVSDEPVLWGGTDNGGAPLPNGVYSFQLEARAAGELVSLAPVQTYGLITEARIEEGQTMLVFESGAVVPAATVGAVRSPQQIY